MRQVKWLFLTLLAALAVGCAPMQPSTPDATKAPDLDLAYYREAHGSGRPVYRIEPGDSPVTVRVYKGGRLARVGHDHVVSSRDARGFVDAQGGRSDLYVAIDSLVVDDAAQRAAAGFETTPSEPDIAGTRSNMLEKVLEAGRFPFVVVRVRAMQAGPAGAILDAQVSLHGVTRPMRIPAKVVTDPERIEVTGHFALKQTDFGIAPFSVLGGALTVQDEVEISFSIRATLQTKKPDL